MQMKNTRTILNDRTAVTAWRQAQPKAPVVADCSAANVSEAAGSCNTNAASPNRMTAEPANTGGLVRLKTLKSSGRQPGSDRDCGRGLRAD